MAVSISRRVAGPASLNSRRSRRGEGRGDAASLFPICCWKKGGRVVAGRGEEGLSNASSSSSETSSRSISSSCSMSAASFRSVGGTTTGSGSGIFNNRRRITRPDRPAIAIEPAIGGVENEVVPLQQIVGRAVRLVEQCHRDECSIHFGAAHPARIVRSRLEHPLDLIACMQIECAGSVKRRQTVIDGFSAG